MPSIKIRVLTGCQMDGLVCALRILFPRDDIAGFHTYRLLTDDRAEIHDDLRTADVVFALPLGPDYGDLSFEKIQTLGPKIQFVPLVVFSAFHPDITYIERLDGRRVQTPMTDYNSIIAVASYLLGFDARQASRLYNAYTYRALGYFDLVEQSQLSLLGDFAAHGIDLRAALGQWLRQPDSFMYSMNHPKSYVLADVAVAASRAAGLCDERAQPSFEDMPDHLGRWVVYPVFREIASRLGKSANEQFKLIGADGSERLSLETFVMRSFEGYKNDDPINWIVSKRIVATQSTLARLTSRSSAVASRKCSLAPWMPPMTYAVPQNVKRIEDCFFYHTTDLGKHGTQQGSWDLRDRFQDYIGGVDLTGRRVLDVGTASGFLSFSAEEAGAREVVSFDLDTADRQHLLPFVDSEYVTDHASWSTKQTAGFQRWKNAYWFTHRLKKSKAKAVYGDVYALPTTIGEFDVIILGAILEHLADPIRALASVTKHARDMIIINTDVIDTNEPTARFNGRPDLPDASYIFWTYSIKTYEHVMGILGFEIEAAKKSLFAAYDSTGARVERERVALVCRRKLQGDIASSRLSRAA